MSRNAGNTKRRARKSCGGCFGTRPSFGGTPTREAEEHGKNSNYVMVEDLKAPLDDSDSASFYTIDSLDPVETVPGEKVCLDNTFLMGSTVPHESSSASGTCWAECSHDIFKIRVGPDYKQNGLKCPSLSFLYEPFGLDVLRSDEMISNVAPHLMFPVQPSYYDAACGFPAVLVVNTQLPLNSPSLFSSSESDPGWSCIGYYRIREEAVEWGMCATGDQPPAVNVFRRMLSRGFSDRSLAFKAIGMVSDLESQDIPMKGLISKYNGKPVLVTASSTFYSGTVPYPYLEIDYNVRKWSLLARTTLVQLSDRLKGVSVHVGYLVEATENEDLPERMLAGTTVRHLDLDSAKFVKFD